MRKYVVARAEELPDGDRLITEIEGRSIGVFNVEGSFYAIRNRCPHQGAELCRGRVVGPPVRCPSPGVLLENDGSPWLQCPWHGWEFELESGRSWIDPARVRVQSYKVELEPLVDREGLFCSEPDERVASEYEAETYSVVVEDDFVVVVLGR